MNLSPANLGENLAQLVWESFSDFLEGGAVTIGGSVGTAALVGRDLVAEELLILFLWVHTRACQQAFTGRADVEQLRAALDALHATVFDDLEAHGIPHDALPLFEQRISARYSEYYAAADHGAGTVGETAARYVGGVDDPAPVLCAAVAESTTAIAGPLRDFLEEVQLEG